MKCLKTLPKSILDEDGLILREVVDLIDYCAPRPEPVSKVLKGNIVDALNLKSKFRSRGGWVNLMREKIAEPEVRCQIEAFVFANRSHVPAIPQENHLFSALYAKVISGNENLQFADEKSPYVYKKDGYFYLNLPGFKRLAKLLEQEKATEQEIDMVLWAWAECHLLHDMPFGEKSGKSSILDSLKENLDKTNLLSVLSWEIDAIAPPDPSHSLFRRFFIQEGGSGEAFFHDVDWDEVKSLIKHTDSLKHLNTQLLRTIEELQEWLTSGRQFFKYSKKILNWANKIEKLTKNLASESETFKSKYQKVKQGISWSKDTTFVKDEAYENYEDLNESLKENFSYSVSNLPNSEEFATSLENLLESRKRVNAKLIGQCKKLEDELKSVEGHKLYETIQTDLVPFQYDLDASLDSLFSRAKKLSVQKVEVLGRLGIEYVDIMEKIQATINEREVGEDWRESEIFDQEKIKVILDSKDISKIFEIFRQSEKFQDRLMKLPLAKPIHELAKECLKSEEQLDEFQNLVARIDLKCEPSVGFLLLRSFFNSSKDERVRNTKASASNLFQHYLASWNSLARTEPLLMLEILEEDAQWIERIIEKVSLKDPSAALGPIHASLLNQKPVSALSKITRLAKSLFSKHPKEFEKLCTVGSNGNIGYYSKTLEQDSRNVTLDHLKSSIEPEGDLGSRLSNIGHKEFKDLASNKIPNLCNDFLIEAGKIDSPDGLQELARSFLQEKFNDFENQVHGLYTSEGTGVTARRKEIPQREKRQLSALQVQCKKFIDNARDYYLAKISYGGIEISQEIRALVEGELTLNAEELHFFEAKETRNVSNCLDMLEEKYALTKGNLNYRDYEFFTVFPNCSSFFPLATSKILNGEKTFAEFKYSELVKELTQRERENAIEILKSGNCWSQLLSFSRQPDSELEEDDALAQREQFCSGLEEEVKGMGADFEPINALFVSRQYPLAKQLVLQIREAQDADLERRQVEKEKLLIGWSEDCASLLSKLKNELKGLGRDIKGSLLVIIDYLELEFEKSSKGEQIDDDLLEQLKDLHHTIVKGSYKFERWRDLLEEYGIGLPGKPGGGRGRKPRVKIQLNENLAFLILGYNEQTWTSKIDSEYKQKWEGLRLDLQKKLGLNLTNIANAWKVSKDGFPFAEYKFIRPNCNYLAEHSVAFFLKPSEMPTSYYLEFCDKLREIDKRAIIPICITEDDSDHNSLESLGNEKLIPICQSNMSRILQEENPKSSFKQFIFRNVSHLSEVNPFTSSGAINDETSIFHGREELIQKLIDNKVSFVCGGRRIGKTSLLKKSQERLEKKGYLTVFYSVGTPSQIAGETGTNLDEFIAERILKRLKGKIDKDIYSRVKESQHGSIDELENILSHLLSINHKVVILLDEYDVYLENSKIAAHESSPLLRMLREIAQDDVNNFRLIIAGFKNLFYHLDPESHPDTGAPLGNFGTTVTVKAWTVIEAEEFIRYAFNEHLGIPVNDQVRRIIKYGSTTPAFLQQFARVLLLRQLEPKIRDENIKVTREDVINTYDTPGIQGEDAFTRFVDATLKLNLSGLGRLTVLAIKELIQRDLPSGKITRNTKEEDLEKSFPQNEIKDHIEEYIEASSADVSLEDEEFRITLGMLTMTHVLIEPKLNVYGVYSASFIRILSKIEDIDADHIEVAINDFKSQKERLGSTHVFNK